MAGFITTAIYLHGADLLVNCTVQKYQGTK